MLDSKKGGVKASSFFSVWKECYKGVRKKVIYLSAFYSGLFLLAKKSNTPQVSATCRRQKV